MGMAAKSSVRTAASAPPYRPNGVLIASQIYACSVNALPVSSVPGLQVPVNHATMPGQPDHRLRASVARKVATAPLQRCDLCAGR